MQVMKRLLLLSMMILTPAIASAQSDTDSNVVWDVTKAVILDPTTYAPAVLSYSSMKMDWDSSQPLFRNGWVEQNRRFTISGRPNDLPVSYAEGNKRIRQMALMHLQESLVNNVAANVFERVLAEQIPAAPEAVQSAQLGRTHRIRVVCLVCRVRKPFQADRAKSPISGSVRVLGKQEIRRVGDSFAKSSPKLLVS